jgi:hypothetical protein
MPGITQQDVTPVVPQVEDATTEDDQDEGYQWGRWLTKPGNELKFLDKQLVNFVNRMNGEEGGKGNAVVVPAVNPRLGAVRIYEKEDEPGEIRQGSPLMREPFQGVVEAASNVGLAGVNAGQNIVEQVVAPIQGREPLPQDPEQALIGRPLAGLKEASANFLDIPQRYELDPADRMFRDLSGEVAVSLGLAWLMGKTPLNPMGSSTSFTGTKLNPLVSPGLKDLVNVRGPLAALFRTKNAAKLRPFLRWSSALGVESMATTALIDNRETPWADPGDDQTRAALKALIPQAGFDFLLAGGLFGTGKGVEKAFQLPELFQSIARNKKAQNTVNDVGQARTWAEVSGLQQRNGEGSYEFIADDPWGTGPVSDAEVSTAFDQPSQAAAAPKNPREAINQMVGSGDRDIPDIWDSSLPEVDVAIRGLDQLDDEGLTAIANRPAEQPIAEALGEQLNRQQQMRQAQEQLRLVGEKRLLQRQRDAAVRSDAADQLQDLKATQETQAVAEAEGINGVPTEQINEMLVPDQDMFEAIDVPQLQQIAALDANVGAELAKAGTSPAKATRRELIDALLKVRQRNLNTVSPIQAPPSAMPAAQRNEVKKQVIRQAINEGQVRPSATEAPELPTPTKKDLDDMTPLEAFDEELRLKDEYQKLDNAKAERIINETREAEGYYQMSPEEQVANGKLDGWEEPSVQRSAELEAAARDLSRISPGQLQGRAESLQQWVNAGRPPEQAVLSDRQAALNVIQGKGQVVNLDKVSGIDMAQALNDRAMGKTTPATEAVRKAYMDFYGLKDKTPAAKPVAPTPPAPAAQPAFVMPQAYAKSKPTFGQAQLSFESDLDRAAYMLQSKTTGAKADRKREVLFAALKEKGISRREALDLGAEVKASIQDGIEEVTGSRKAPQERFTVQVPKSALAATSEPRLGRAGGDELSSIDLPDVPKRAGGDVPMEERFAKAMNLRVEQLETELKGIAEQIFGDDLPDFKFNRDEVREITAEDWGGDGIKTSKQGGSYTFGLVNDLITINELRNRPISELRITMFHEAWHRIQRGYLKPKELKVLDNVFAQRDLANYASLPGGKNIKQIEVQAVAFQNYAAIRDRGETRMDYIRDAVVAELETAFPGFKGWQKKLTVKALTAIAEGWERIRGFASRSKNFIDGNGFQNVYDLFERAYDGKLTQGRRFEDATKTIDEVLGMTEAQVEALTITGDIKKIDASFDAAIERSTYFNKWRGKANNVLNSIDTEIAALKKLATEGGC